MPRKVKRILNPMVDMGRAWKTANDLRPIAQEFNGELTWSGTVYPSHAIELARQAAEEGYDMVVAKRGDGTDRPVATIVEAIAASGYAAIGCGQVRKARVDGRVRRACWNFHCCPPPDPHGHHLRATPAHDRHA